MNELSRALKLYLGRPEAAWPQARSDDVRNAFGDEILERIGCLLKEADEVGSTGLDGLLIDEMYRVQTEMSRRHPELGSEAVGDIGWAWSYWNK